MNTLKISAITFGLLSTIVLVLLIGIVAYLFSPHGSTQDELALAIEILVPFPSILQPKPETRLAFGAVVAGLPLIALASALAAKRIGLVNKASLIDLGLFATGVAGAIFTLRSDPVLPSAGLSKAEFTLSALGGVVLALVSQRYPTAASKKVRIGTTFTLCLSGVFLTFALRVFDYNYVTAETAHLGAYLYSINQTVLGGTCLNDVVTQYGCYGEFYRPIFGLIDLSIYNLTLVNAALQSSALVAVLVFSSFLIARPVTLVAFSVWAIMCLYRIDPSVYDVYFQYTPLRFLFPALSLLMAMWWCRAPCLMKATLIGVFSAAAIFNNLDSGAVVAVALGTLIFLSSIGLDRNSAMKMGWFALAYSLAVFGSLFAIQALLSYRSGVPVDLAAMSLYAKIFAGSGFMMLPTPKPPSAWTLAAFTAAASAAVYSLRVVQGRASARDHLLAYSTVLGIGLFSYYLGRSHPFVLPLCIWPLMIAAFAMLDALSLYQGPWGATLRAGSLIMVGFLVLAASIVIVRVAPPIVTMAATRWQQIGKMSPMSPVAEDIAFIRSNVSASESFEVLAVHQATIYSEMHKRSNLPGPGVAEILLRRDADNLIKALVEEGPSNLFIDRELLERQPLLMNTSSWLEQSMPTLHHTYALKSWSKGNRLMHLVRKPFAGEDLFETHPTCATVPHSSASPICYRYNIDLGSFVGPNGRKSPFPFDIAPTSPNGAFSLGLVVVPDGKQVAYSTIASSHCCSFQGFVVHALPGDRSEYVLTVGNGAQWLTSEPFHLKDQQPNAISIKYQNEVLALNLDGSEVARIHAKMEPSAVGLTVGDWFARSRTFSGRIDEAWYLNQ
ncbi:hypothetical protein [Microvirga zambiensis]|uniref:hypothetical protein n=1 Tax=Microvirga zambiensis TaxID=1402137 RepID=UPI00191EBB9D|nr:hypothetical protein [Microvirga zambiensis]